jgi:chromate transporter
MGAGDALAAVLALFRFNVGMMATLTGCSLAGVVLYLAGVIA